MSIWPAFAPDVGKPTCTEFGIKSPALKFNDDVDATPVASPGRTDKNPFADGDTTVTFNNTPVAPTGTGVCVPVEVGTAPVTCNFCDTADTNGPGNPTSERVSRTRTGSTVITDDAGPDAALTATIPPPPNVTATAAPTAAQRDLHKPRRSPAAATMIPPQDVMRQHHPAAKVKLSHIDKTRQSRSRHTTTSPSTG
ncbi:MAG TPA: hypothetical protein VES40_19710 [Ilumatobacteraceae bacterium]|nr:hypothetical protein [Ilumatobacteraceae bacterium]